MRQLLERAAGRVGGRRGARRPGARAFRRRHRASPSPADARFAVLHGLYWLVGQPRRRATAALVVDDAQWADEPSLRFLAYLARRVRELPVAIVVAARPAAAGRGPVGARGDRGRGRGARSGAAHRGRDRRARRAAVRDGAARVRRCLPARDGRERAARRGGAGRARDAGPRGGRGRGRGAGGSAGRAAAGGARSPAPRRWPRPSPCWATAAELLARGRARRARPRRRARRGGRARGRRPARRRRHAALPAPADPRGGRRAPALGRARGRRMRAPRGCWPSAALRRASIAAHLLAAPPAADPWVPEACAKPRARARGQGAPEIAAAYLRRALAEPPADRVEVLLELGRVRARRGRARRRRRGSRRPGGRRTTPRSRSSSRRCWASAPAGPTRRRMARAVLAGRTGSRLGETELHLFALLADVVRMDPTIGGDEPERLQTLAATLDGRDARRAVRARRRGGDQAGRHRRRARAGGGAHAAHAGRRQSLLRHRRRVELHPRRPARAGRGGRRGGAAAGAGAAGSCSATRRSSGCAGGSGSSAAALPEARDDFEHALAFAR